ncbi:MAG: DUF6868 family protein [Candidatus Sedimenticola sp. 20ELBAFRAG]
MDMDSLTALFMWCTIINGGLLLTWTLAVILAPDLVYRTQSLWFSISRERFDLVIYCFIGLFKILFLVFNLVPYLALLIIA